MLRSKILWSVFSAVILLVLSVGADAQRNDRQVRDITRSLNSRADDFQYRLDSEIRSGTIDRQDADDLRRGVDNLLAKLTEFDENLSQRKENRDDVNAIITAAKDIDSFLRSGRRMGGTVEADWQEIRNLINRLAANYGVTPDWSGRVSGAAPVRNYPAPAGTTPRTYPQTTAARQNAATSGSLTGTYRLDAARSENTNDILTNVSVSGTNRQDLETKLEAPDQIAIDIRGNQVILASSKASPVSFTADGREKSEQSGGRTVRLRASMRGQELVVSSLGGESDYTITFTPTDAGRGMKVTRRITTEYLSETVIAESFYTRTEAIARLGIDTDRPAATDDGGTYSSNDPVDIPGRTPTIGPGRTGDYAVPNGTVLTGLLETAIDTKISQNNDRFKMIVQSPDEFRGAMVEGFLTGVGRSGQVTGRSNVTFNFDRITLRDGRSYDFAGTLQSVKDQFGKDVRVDAEGTAKGQSQTKETAKRGGLGAGLGALIGAIAGGGQGAAIGAIIGGGVGAGSVVVQGRDDVQLLKGSIITVQASAPTSRVISQK